MRVEAGKTVRELTLLNGGFQHVMDYGKLGVVEHQLANRTLAVLPLTGLSALALLSLAMPLVTRRVSLNLYWRQAAITKGAREQMHCNIHFIT